MPRWPYTTRSPMVTQYPTITQAPVESQFPWIDNPLELVPQNTVVEWLRADQGVTQVAGAVSQWSGSFAGIAGTAAGAKQPTYSASNASFNGQPTITGDGIANELVFPLAIPAPGTSPRFYWFVFSLNAWTASACIMGSGGGNVQLVFCSAASPQLRQFNAALGNVNGNATLNTARRGEAWFSFTNTDYLRIGSVTSTPTTAGNSSSASWALFSGNGSNYCSCSVAEALILSAKPAQQVLDRLSTYASNRYGSGVVA